MEQQSLQQRPQSSGKRNASYTSAPTYRMKRLRSHDPDAAVHNPVGSLDSIPGLCSTSLTGAEPAQAVSTTAGTPSVPDAPTRIDNSIQATSYPLHTLETGSSNSLNSSKHEDERSQVLHSSVIHTGRDATDEDADTEYRLLYGSADSAPSDLLPPSMPRIKTEYGLESSSGLISLAASVASPSINQHIEFIVPALKYEVSSHIRALGSHYLVPETEDEEEDWAFSGAPEASETTSNSHNVFKEPDVRHQPTVNTYTSKELPSPPPTPVLDDVYLGKPQSALHIKLMEVAPEAAPLAASPVVPSDQSTMGEAMIQVDDSVVEVEVDDDWLSFVAPPNFVPEDPWAGSSMSPAPQESSSPAPAAESDLSEQSDDDYRDSVPGDYSSDVIPSSSTEGLDSAFQARAIAGDRIQCALCGRWLRLNMTTDHVVRLCGKVPPPGRPHGQRGMYRSGRKRRKHNPAAEAARLAHLEEQERTPSGQFARSSSAFDSPAAPPPPRPTRKQRIAKAPVHKHWAAELRDDPWVLEVALERGSLRCAGCEDWIDLGGSITRWTGRKGHKNTCLPIIEDTKRQEEDARLRTLLHADEKPAAIPPELWNDTRVRRIDGDQAQCDECGIWTLFKNWEAHHTKCPKLKSRKQQAKTVQPPQYVPRNDRTSPESDPSDLTSESGGEGGVSAIEAAEVAKAL